MPGSMKPPRTHESNCQECVGCGVLGIDGQNLPQHHHSALRIGLRQVDAGLLPQLGPLEIVHHPSTALQNPVPTTSKKDERSSAAATTSNKPGRTSPPKYTYNSNVRVCQAKIQ